MWTRLFPARVCVFPGALPARVTPTAVPRVPPLARRFPLGEWGGREGLPEPSLARLTYFSRLGCPRPLGDMGGGLGFTRAHSCAAGRTRRVTHAREEDRKRGRLRMRCEPQHGTPPRSRPRGAARAAATPAALAPRPCGALHQPIGSNA